MILAVAAAIAALLLLPAALRSRRRRRRLARAGSGEPGAAGASWTELEDTAIDHGIGPQPGESARMVANRLARHAHLVDADRARLHQLVLAAEREWYDTAAHTAPARSAATARIHDTAAAVTIGDHRAGPGNDGALLAATSGAWSAAFTATPPSAGPAGSSRGPCVRTPDEAPIKDLSRHIPTRQSRQCRQRSAHVVTSVTK